MNQEEILISVITTTALVLLLVGGLAVSFMFARRQSMKQQLVLSQTKLAFEQELRTVETEVSESVMAQFAQELHDNIGQLLTALHIQIENQKLDHPALADSFKPAEIYISEINQQLRMLSRTLNTDYIGHIGLLGGIQLETERLNKLKRFTVRYEGNSGPSNLAKNQELMAFRIFQEIMQNALRHSRAKNVIVTVLNPVNEFEMRIGDDGKGFDVDATLKSSKASGLRNIIKRAQLAGLDLSIKSEPGEGSLFVLKKVGNLG